ncbi:MAG: hypothetical protein AAF902_10835 [Chloroflexota bacterium]
MPLPTTTPDPLITENAVAFADLDTLLIGYQYNNIIDTDVTTDVYNWMIHGMRTWFNEDDFRGAIFDFRNVNTFALGNTLTAKEASEEANQVLDLSIFPVALIVKNVQQEIKVRMTMMTGNTRRKCVVYGEDQALVFINEWNRQHNRKFDLPSENFLNGPAFDKLMEP